MELNSSMLKGNIWDLTVDFVGGKGSSWGTFCLTGATLLEFSETLDDFLVDFDWGLEGTGLLLFEVDLDGLSSLVLIPFLVLLLSFILLLFGLSQTEIKSIY